MKLKLQKESVDTVRKLRPCLLSEELSAAGKKRKGEYKKWKKLMYLSFLAPSYLMIRL